MKSAGARQFVVTCCLLMHLSIGVAAAVAQTVAAVPPPATAPTSGQLAQHPARLTWAFHLDASWGTFGFANTLFGDAADPAVPSVRDRWFEGLIKPGLSIEYALPGESLVFGKASVVGERTYGSLPSDYGLSVASFEVEDLAVGWKSGTSIARFKENAVEISVGRMPYKIGNGFLVFDGADDGGSRGGYWTNGHRAWKMGALGRLAPNAHTVEAFYLEKNELPGQHTGAGIWGVNYEWAPGEGTTLGAAWLHTKADADAAPDRAGMDVLNLRAFTAPITTVPDLAFEFEYAHERNANVFQSDAWTLKSSYTLSAVPWQPTVSYRYAWFEGDDPGTARRESFDPLFLGFTDWGTWWQGEIAGEYLISNSNLGSHQVRLHLDPTTKVGTGLIFYRFRLNRPVSYGPTVSSRDLAVETDWYLDWKLTKRFTLSGVAALADPGPAAQQKSGRTRNLTYGMLYVGWIF